MVLNDFLTILTDFLQVLFLGSETILEWLDTVEIFEITLLGWLYIGITGAYLLSLFNDYFSNITNEKIGGTIE